MSLSKKSDDAEATPDALRSSLRNEDFADQRLYVDLTLLYVGNHQPLPSVDPNRVRVHSAGVYFSCRECVYVVSRYEVVA